MKTNHKALLHDAVSEFIQLHAFDHLMDHELAQLKSLLNQWAFEEPNQELTEKLVPYLTKVNFFVESISPAAIQLWFYAMSYNNIPVMNVTGNIVQDNNELVY
jgi:hypothetical protein